MRDFSRDYREWLDNLNPYDFIWDMNGHSQHRDPYLMDIKIGDVDFTYLAINNTVDDKGDIIYRFMFQSNKPFKEGFDNVTVYPLLYIGVKSHYTKSGKFEPSIIKTGFYKTEFV